MVQSQPRGLLRKVTKVHKLTCLGGPVEVWAETVLTTRSRFWVLCSTKFPSFSYSHKPRKTLLNRLKPWVEHFLFFMGRWEGTEWCWGSNSFSLSSRLLRIYYSLNLGFLQFSICGKNMSLSMRFSIPLLNKFWREIMFLLCQQDAC